MAKQIINIGTEGNDNTGDAIREAFNKVNENFTELYAVFGIGGRIDFTSLSDVPDVLTPYTVPMANAQGSAIEMKSLVAGTGMTIQTTSPTQIVISNTSSIISTDGTPSLGGPLNAANQAIANAAVSVTAVNALNSAHGTNFSIDDLVITKKYADGRYLRSAGSPGAEGQVRVRLEPSDASEYTFTISSFANGNIVVSGGHGFTTTSNGISYKYNSTGTDATGLVSGTKYYLRYVSDTELSVHTSLDEAQNSNDQTRVKISLTTGTGTGVQTMTDAEYDASLQGYFVSTEAIPRISAVRRQGDDLAGPVYAHDHPGSFAGAGTPNGKTDLQLATKLYVDNSAFPSVANLYVATSGDDKMSNVPVGQEGRAWNYAYKTIAAACAKAEEIIDTSPIRVGPYVQDITYNSGANKSTVVSSGITSSSGYEEVKILTDLNRKFLIEETIAYLDQTYPNLLYDRELCRRDLGLIADGIVLDILDSTLANYHSRNAGLRYYSSASGQIARTTQQTETIASLNFAKALHAKIITNTLETNLYQTTYTQQVDTNQVVDLVGQTSVGAKWDIIKTIVVGPDYKTAAPQLVEGSTWTINISHGGQGYVDQNVITNQDLIPGKLIIGKQSGAVGRIVSVTRDGQVGVADVVTLELLEPKTFEVGEEIEYGNRLTVKNISIHIESGTYIEHLPIKVPVGVSIKGDEFRRVIVKPKDGVSQSRWAETYFYREPEFDGLELKTSSNPNALTLLSANKEYIKDETIAWINAQVALNTGIWAGFTYDAQKCERDTGIILDGIYYDLKWGGNEKTHFNASRYYEGTSSLINGQESQTAAAIEFTRDLVINNILANSAYASLQTKTSQTINANNGEAAASTSVASLMNIIRDVITSGLSSLPALNSTSYGYHYLTDHTKVTDVGASYTNAGGYTDAAFAISEAKEDIQTAVVNHINALSPLSLTDQTKSRRDTGNVVDAIVADLRAGGRENILTQQGKFLGVTLDANCLSGMAHIATYINASVINTQSATVQNLVTNFVTTVLYAFDSSYNPPKRNDEMDVFLMNDTTILRNISVQGHGGFMAVLDPEGIVLTKSPYMQTGTSFSKSQNKQVFAGGMFIDGFVGNLRTVVTAINNPFSINVQSALGEGLRKKKPQVPCPFYINGKRYQVNSFTNYDQQAGTATLLLDPTSNGGAGFSQPLPTHIVLQTPGNRSMLANDFTQINDLGYGTVVTNTGLSELVSQFTYYCQAAYYADKGGEIRSLNGSNAYGEYGLVATGSDPNEVPDIITTKYDMVRPVSIYDDGVTYTHAVDQLYMYVYELDFVPLPNSEVEIDHGGVLGTTRYEVTTVQATGQTAGSSVIDGTVYRLNLATTGSDNTSSTGLKAAPTNGQHGIIRMNLSHHLDGVESVASRPSSALVFDQNPNKIYRTLNFGTTDGLGNALPGTERLVRFDSPYEYVKLVIDNTNAVLNTYAGTGTTMGATQGDNVIAVVSILSQSTLDRINAGDMIFAWDGKLHIIESYTQRVGFGTISISDVAGSNVNSGYGGAGLNSTVVNVTNNVTLRAGLAGGEGGNITVNISLCRATGHDFLNIGTGGYNTSNFPNVVLGEASQPKDQSREVDERDKGRVFYVSTDQDGFFRVGRFFTVDQGTGTVTFSASIALSNLDGIGFKRGVVVAEFSADDGMTDNSTDTVPVESAVRGYVNRRLHFDHGGNPASNPIGPGALARDGTTSMTGNLNAGGFRIESLSDPAGAQDAATKSYVDGLIKAGDTLGELVDTEINNIAGDQLLGTTGKYRIYTVPASGGNFQIGDLITGSFTGGTGTIVEVENISIGGSSFNLLVYTPGTGAITTADVVITSGGVSAQVDDGPHKEWANLVEDAASDINVVVSRDASGSTVEYRIAPDSIVNADVNANAGIQQTKLAMNAASTRANATGITQNDLGVASFDSSIFTSTNGWITIDNGDLDYRKIINIADGTALGRAAGDSSNGDVAEIPFATIVSEGGGVQENVSTTGAVNSLVKTDNLGNADMQGLKIDGYLIADTSGTEIQFTTPGGALFLSSAGTVTPTIEIPGSVNIGNTGVTQGFFQTNSALAGESRLAVDWIHASFIEAPGELDANGTGVAIGANTGYTAAGQIGLISDGQMVLRTTSAGFEPSQNNTYNIGTTSLRYNTLYAAVYDGTSTQARYADLAENYLADKEYEVGFVLIFGGEQEVTTTQLKGDTRVAGVVSENPAHLMNSQLEGDHVTAVALQGRTPIKVVGIVRKGDLLVSASIPGFAIVDNNAKVGSVIGKALQAKDDPGHGVIEAVVGRV